MKETVNEERNISDPDRKLPPVGSVVDIIYRPHHIEMKQRKKEENQHHTNQVKDGEVDRAVTTVGSPMEDSQ